LREQEVLELTKAVSDLTELLNRSAAIAGTTSPAR
jgi:hypothetical protein